MKDEKPSFIYRHVFIYRLIMNILYGFKYKKRFAKVIKLIRPEDKAVVELCFGDIFIAQYCRQEGKGWIGFDLNENFVKFARKNNFNAHLKDVLLLEEFPRADVIIMIGSLYHFYSTIRMLFEKICRSSRRFILSEPIINLTHQKGVLGILAKRFTNAGKGEENFRFNESSLLETLESLKKELNFNYQIVDKKRDMIIEIIW
jgi:hypothetical protein